LRTPDDFLAALLWAGITGREWPKRTRLFASIKTKYGTPIFEKRFEDNVDGHAEIAMLRSSNFLDVVEKNHNIEITLTLNYSPCSSCAKELKKIYEKDPYNSNIKNFTIQFSHLDMIDEEKNKTGLRNLNEAGVTLQAMNAESWREVGIDLESIPPLGKKRINERDNKTGSVLLRQVLNRNFLKTLLLTGVTGTKWPKRTYLIVSIKAEDGKSIFEERFQNSCKEHAEKVMLRNLNFLDVVEKNINIQITLTLNYSPCSNCAIVLKEFYEEDVHKSNIKYFTIQFSFIYYVKNKENRTGLQNLSEAGVTLQAMNAESWREVGIDLESFTPEDKEKINKRDNDTANDLNEVLFTNKQDQDESVDELSSQLNAKLRAKET
ncbi:uncharacterized protein LOC111319976, partial [Stylophora pistillata]|uniref:uncharacterized protein LOC111319976 n=1 Tax=Stylophora pistillata TaxID=50429 RepID=UPI000C041E09